MVRNTSGLIDILDKWSDDRDEIDVYTSGDNEPTYSGFIIHVGADYLAMGNQEGKNLYDTLIPIASITKIRHLIPGDGVSNWVTPQTNRES